MTLQEARSLIASKLQEAGVEAADYESWVFLDWKLGVSRGDYYMNPLMDIPEDKGEELFAAVEERAKRIPLQYLMESCDFMGFEFYVDERVLIPRHDTECLVDLVVQQLRDRVTLQKIRKSEEKIRVLDMCTGSGCIGISIKLLVPDAEVVLSDLSQDAIHVAEKNAEKLGTDVKIMRGNLFDSLEHLPKEEKSFDFIVSNPPYIKTAVVEELMPEVKDFEPHMALDGEEDGLEFYRRITQAAPTYLKQYGALFYEIGAEQGHDVENLMKEAGFQEVSVVKDLAGLDRIVKGRLS